MTGSINRREVLVLGLAIADLVILPKAAIAQRSEKIEVEWHVAPDQVSLLKENMPVHNVKTYDQRNPLLIGAIVLIGASVLPKIAQAIMDVYYRYKSGGVIIDMRTQPITISTNSRVAPGYALVISKSGAQTVQLGGTDAISSKDTESLTGVLKAAM